MVRVTHLKKELDMCSRPLLGKLIKFSIPLILSGILQLLYNAADLIVVGQFSGSDAMAAVGSTGSLVNLLTNLFIGLSVGTLASVARYIGANDKDSVEKIVHTSVVISVLGGIVLAVAGFFLSDFLLLAMQTPPDVLKLSSLYLKIFFLGMPFNLLYNFGSSILRACGDTRRPMLFLTIAGIINIGLNLLFVIVFEMSVAGVALATIISQAISAVLVLLCLFRSKGHAKVTFKKLKIDKTALLRILRIGLPAGVQSTIFSISNVIIQSSINSMGNIVMSANAAAANLEGFVYVAMNSISQASLTFTGQNFGARNKQNINLVLIQSTCLVTVVGLLLGGGVYFAGNILLGLYNTDPAVIKFGLERLLVIGSTYFLCGIMEVIVGSLRGIGKSMLPMLVSIVGVCGLRIVWIFTFFAKSKNLTMLYAAYPISWLMTCIVQLLCFIAVKKKVYKTFGKISEAIPDAIMPAVIATTDSAIADLPELLDPCLKDLVVSQNIEEGANSNTTDIDKTEKKEESFEGKE